MKKGLEFKGERIRKLLHNFLKVNCVCELYGPVMVIEECEPEAPVGYFLREFTDYLMVLEALGGEIEADDLKDMNKELKTRKADFCLIKKNGQVLIVPKKGKRSQQQVDRCLEKCCREFGDLVYGMSQGQILDWITKELGYPPNRGMVSKSPVWEKIVSERPKVRRGRRS